MKNPIAIIALVCTALVLTACGGSETDEPLPQGTAPNDAQPEGAVDAADASGDATDDDANNANNAYGSYDSDAPDPVAQTPATAPPLPLPLPAASDDAERLTAPGISYVLPEGWTVGGDRQMRLLTLLPPDAGETDLAISRWPGDVGGFASNVQRWVAQVGLAKMQNLTTAAASDFEKFDVGGTTATWIPLMNEQNNVAILAVWVPRGENPANPTETWTFKLTCKAEEVATLAPAMRAFCESVKFD